MNYDERERKGCEQATAQTPNFVERVYTEIGTSGFVDPLKIAHQGLLKMHELFYVGVEKLM